MDRIDRKIIDILQTNARAPLKEIADRVFLSSPAVLPLHPKLRQCCGVQLRDRRLQHAD